MLIAEEFAYKAGFRDVQPMRDWFYMELNSGFSFGEALEVCDRVIGGQQYRALTKNEFIAKKGQVYRHMGRANLYTDSEKVVRSFESAVRQYLEAMSFSTQRGFDGSKAAAWVEDAFSELVLAANRHGKQAEVLDFVKSEVGGLHTLTPLVRQLTRFIAASVTSHRAKSNAVKNALSNLRNRVMARNVNNLSPEDKKAIADAVESALPELS